MNRASESRAPSSIADLNAEVAKLTMFRRRPDATAAERKGSVANLAVYRVVRQHLPLLLHQPAQHGCHSDPSIASLRHQVLPFWSRREWFGLGLGESGVKQGSELIRLHVITPVSQSANCRTWSVSEYKRDGRTWRWASIADELFLGHNSVIVGAMITSVLNIADASAA